MVLQKSSWFLGGAPWDTGQGWGVWSITSRDLNQLCHVLSKLKPSSLSTSASPAGSGSFWILPEGLSAAVKAGQRAETGVWEGVCYHWAPFPVHHVKRLTPVFVIPEHCPVKRSSWLLLVYQILVLNWALTSSSKPCSFLKSRNASLLSLLVSGQNMETT